MPQEPCLVFISDETKNDLADQIQVTSPQPNDLVNSPLEIQGQAVGYWFFEASFPVVLIDDSRNVIAQGYIETTEDWMTEDFVNFSGELEFETTANEGYLILKNDNPSGLPEKSKQIEIPVMFK